MEEEFSSRYYRRIIKMVVSFRSTTTSLVCHHKNLWTYDGSLTALYGIFRLPSRMTIICSEEINKLGIISPFPPTDTIKNLIDEIVKSFVFGNRNRTEVRHFSLFLRMSVQLVLYN